MKVRTTVLGAFCVFSSLGLAQEVPKVGAYLGYDYVRFNSDTNVPAFNGHGGNGQFIYNFNSWLGGVLDAGAVHNGSFAGFNLDSTFVNFLAGPRVSFRQSHRVIPYVQTLFGGIYATSSAQITVFPDVAQTAIPAIVPNQALTARINTSQTKFAMTAGGGLDIRISKHFTVRPISVDYYLTRLQNLRTADDNNQNNIRASAGIGFWFGGPKAAVVNPAPPPATHSCPDGTTVPVNQPCPKQNLSLNLSASQAEVCPGETVQVSAAIGGASPSQLTYNWSVNGQAVSQGKTFLFDSNGKAPGTYTIGLNVGGGGFNSAAGETAISVREYRPPTGTVQANPAQIRQGESSSLSASFDGQCGGAIGRPTFTASEGSIQGDQFDSTGVKFDASMKSEQRKTVTITASAADNRNVGTATTTIEVTKDAVIAPIRLPDILFSQNSSRVNNCGKRILLEQLRSYFERDSGGKVVLVGHTSNDETAADLASKRADNSAAIVTNGSGICLSIPATQVMVSAPGANQNGVPFEAGFCSSSVRGASEARRVEVWFVPSGGTMPASADGSQAASVLSLGSLGCPK